MSLADSQLEFDDLRPHKARSAPARAGVWLTGDVVCCACPDCGSPISIRVWLMAADCWVCGTSVILTEEQQREVERLLQEVEARKSVEQLPIQAPVPEKPVPPQEQPKAPAAKAPAPVEEQPPAPAHKPREKRRALAPVVPAGPVSAAQSPNRVLQRLKQAGDEGEVTVWFRDFFRNLPAWLISALLHMALLILLALLWEVDKEQPERPLILSTRVGLDDRPGAEEDPPGPDPLLFDKKGEEQPKKEDIPQPPEKKEPVKPEPKEQPEPGPAPKIGPAPQDPRKGTLGGSGGSSLAGRNPQARPRLAEQEGATIASEVAVARGLEWLARHQNSDGSWSLHNFHRAGECKGRCGQPGVQSDTSGTALALLPFLGAGETHRQGKYRDVVRKGLSWLVRNQGRDGDLRGAGNGQMYAHGQCSIALCEAFALTQDEALRAPAQLAIDFVVKAQHSEGGWRYQPGQAGDVSIVGWQIMALRSAQMAYLRVPPEVFEKSNKFLDSCQCDGYGSTYGYMPGSGPRPAMTAEGLLCRQYSGWDRQRQGLVLGCRQMLQQNPPAPNSRNMYYWYYATQVMHHMGGPVWKSWNEKMRDLLVKTQESKGHQAGSWTSQEDDDRHNRMGGRLYMTALAVCTLEVYYRHLPLYRNVAVDE